MLTASDWWLLSVAGLRLWLRSLLLAHFLLTSQQLTQSISALLNPFGSRDAPAKRIILKQIRATACGGHLKTIFIIKADRSSERGVGLNFRSSDRSYRVGLWDSLVKSGVMLSHGSFISQVWVENISTPFAGKLKDFWEPKSEQGLETFSGAHEDFENLSRNLSRPSGSFPRAFLCFFLYNSRTFLRFRNISRIFSAQKTRHLLIYSGIS